MVGLASADTFHFNSGTITATVSGYEVIGNTFTALHGKAGVLDGWGTVDGSCGFCGSYSALTGIMPTFNLGIESATINGSAVTLWSGLIITGNAFLLPAAFGNMQTFTATTRVNIAGYFLGSDGTTYTVPKHGLLKITYRNEDGNWVWDSAKLVMVPEPTALALVGSGLLFVWLGWSRRRRHNAHFVRAL